MPFKSQAQRAKFYKLYEEGKITKEQLDNWVKETGDSALPKKIYKKTPAIRKPVRIK